MSYVNETARNSCVTLWRDMAGCGCACNNWKTYTFALLMIASLGALIIFCMGALGVMDLTKGGLIASAIGGSLFAGMIALDCLKYMQCH